MAASEYSVHDSPERRIDGMITKQDKPTHKKRLDGREAQQVSKIGMVGPVHAKNEKKAN